MFQRHTTLPDIDLYFSGRKAVYIVLNLKQHHTEKAYGMPYYFYCHHNPMWFAAGEYDDSSSSKLETS